MTEGEEMTGERAMIGGGKSTDGSITGGPVKWSPDPPTLGVIPGRGSARILSAVIMTLCMLLLASLFLLIPEGDRSLGDGYLLFLVILAGTSIPGMALLNEYGRLLGLGVLWVSVVLFLVQSLSELVILPHLIIAMPSIWYLMRYEVMQHFDSRVVEFGGGPVFRRSAAMIKRGASHLILFSAVLVATFPVIWVISTSLKPGNMLIDTEMQIIPETVTLEHYRQVIFEEDFFQYLLNSLICAGGTALLTIFLATTGAYALSKFDFKGKKAALLSFIVVQMFPGVIIIVPYFILLNHLGLLNSHIGLIAAYSVTALPLCVWTMKGFFDTIPDDLIEAARVDGYSHSRIFWKIMLPLAKPGLAVTTLFAFLAAWNEYVLAYTFMLDQKYYTLPVKIYMYIGGSSVRWGTFSAMSVLVSIPVVVLFIIFQRYLTSGLTKGAVKG